MTTRRSGLRSLTDLTPLYLLAGVQPRLRRSPKQRHRLPARRAALQAGWHRLVRRGLRRHPCRWATEFHCGGPQDDAPDRISHHSKPQPALGRVWGHSLQRRPELLRTRHVG